MTELILTALLGIAIGSWRMRSLRNETRWLVGAPGRPRHATAQLVALRSVPVIFFTVVVLVLSTGAVIAALAGYWFGRTGQLAVAAMRRDWGQAPW